MKVSQPTRKKTKMNEMTCDKCGLRLPAAGQMYEFGRGFLCDSCIRLVRVTAPDWWEEHALLIARRFATNEKETARLQEAITNAMQVAAAEALAKSELMGRLELRAHLGLTDTITSAVLSELRLTPKYNSPPAD